MVVSSLDNSPLLRARSVDTPPQSTAVSPSHHHPTKPTPTRGRTSHDKTSCLSTLRWVLLGIMIGSTATGFLQSLHLPSICINLTVNSSGDEANSNLHPLEKMHKERLKAKKQHKHHQLSNLLPANGTNGTLLDNPTPFINLPPAPTLMHNESFAACLLIKDDNHWLIEWLAYHYFVMPLRHLIVVIDPESKTSPRNILDRYSSRGLMDIRIWKDEDFMPARITATAEMFDNNTALMMHRVRQNNFYRRCIPTLRNRKHEWVMLVDTDEYVLPSYASGHFRNLTSQVSFLEGGSVLRLLKYYEQVAKVHHTCVYMPRFFYGAKESRDALVKHAVPPPIKPMNMLTQRYLYREPRRNYNGKNLMNTYRVRELKTFGGVHHVAEACPDPEQERRLDQNKHALVRVHHYLGTKEQYMFRDDPRLHSNNNHTNATKFGSFSVRGSKRYEEYNRKANHEDHAAKAWIRGFIKEMGIEVAGNLLQGVGQVGVE